MKKILRTLAGLTVTLAGPPITYMGFEAFKVYFSFRPLDPLDFLLLILGIVLILAGSIFTWLGINTILYSKEKSEENTSDKP
ncbi:hypothetical protein LCGC14_0738820 [marine sediment metagenome]|uniref:Uncharacterized protein n=1 Tax=marine sediment metagenome TaxID=412755 RepID=A0A0F9QSG5_9ZZZZ